MIGKTIGSYRITKQVARGGTALLFQGSHAACNQEVAIKWLDRTVPGFSDHRTRMKKEAEWSASMQAPGIARTLEFGDEESGCYLIQEWIDGRPLHHILREESKPGKGLETGRALKIAAELADALAHLHAAGIVHSDLKPPNVLCSAERTVVCDLGMAVAEGSLRPMGIVMGTPFYMSPEQALGRLIDRRSDLWSLGVILFEMLSGARPFGLRTDSPQRILEKIQTAPLPKLLERHPPEVRIFTEFLLDKNKMQRPDDATDVAVKLRYLFKERASGSCSPGFQKD